MIKIKNAGLKLFATRGLAATSIMDISELAGISTGLIYHYYLSKEDLYAELVMIAVKSANSAVVEIVEMQLPPGEKITRLATEILEKIRKSEIVAYFYVLMPQVFLNGTVPEKAKPFLKSAYFPIEAVKNIIISGQHSGEIRDGDPAALSSFFFSSITGMCTYKLMMGRRFKLPPIDMLTSILLKKSIA